MQGNDGRDEEGNEALINELGASPATSESDKLVNVSGFLEGHDITVADGAHAYTQALRGDTIPGGNLGDPVQYVELGLLYLRNWCQAFNSLWHSPTFGCLLMVYVDDFKWQVSWPKGTKLGLK